MQKLSGVIVSGFPRMLLCLVVAAVPLLIAPGASADTQDSFTLVDTSTSDIYRWQLAQSPVPPEVVLGDNFDFPTITGTKNGSSTCFADLTFFNSSSANGGGVGDNPDCPDGFFGPSGILVGDQLYTGSEDAPTFKTGTFVLSDLGTTDDVWSLTIAPASATVPEPSSLLLLGSGFLVVAWRRRRLG
jgi:hypothetical protein